MGCKLNSIKQENRVSVETELSRGFQPQFKLFASSSLNLSIVDKFMKKVSALLKIQIAEIL